MHSKIIASICIIIIFSTNIKAQDSLKNFKINTIYFSPLKLINNEVELGIEHKLNRLSSIKFDASLIWLNNNEYANIYSSYGDEMMGSNLTFSFRKYVFYNQIINKKRSENLWGVYISPMVQYQYLERKSKHESFDINGNSTGMISEKNHQNAFTPGVLTGMRFDLAKGLITLDFNVGFGVKFPKVIGVNNGYFGSDERMHYFGRKGLMPLGNMAIGFNF